MSEQFYSVTAFSEIYKSQKVETSFHEKIIFYYSRLEARGGPGRGRAPCQPRVPRAVATPAVRCRVSDPRPALVGLEVGLAPPLVLPGLENRLRLQDF